MLNFSKVRPLSVLVLINGLWSVIGTGECGQKPFLLPNEWIDIPMGCSDALKQQIQIEISASIQFLAMGAFFSRDSVNRPGFAALFFKSANEERLHAIKIIDYLLVRGKLCKTKLSDLIHYPRPTKTLWGSGLEALIDALTLETSMTKRLKKMVEICEGDQNHIDTTAGHFLITAFLDEQAKTTRDFGGRVSCLGRMMEDNPQLGDFLYDKSLLRFNIIKKSRAITDDSDSEDDNGDDDDDDDDD